MRSHITIETKKNTLQPSAQSLGSQKTSIGFGNIHIDNWY